MADLSLQHGGGSVAPPTRRTVHRTYAHAGGWPIARAELRCALMLTHLSFTRWHSVDLRESRWKISCLVQQEPVVRRGGQEVEGRREEVPLRSARRKQSGQRGRGAGLVGVRRVCLHATRTCELRGGTEGASRWVWRGGSTESTRTFAAGLNITSIGATSLWGRTPSAIAFRHAAAAPPAAPPRWHGCPR